VNNRLIDELPLVATIYAIILVVFVPATSHFRSPGSVCGEWWICAIGTVGLLAINLWGLNALRHQKWGKRLPLYLSLSVAIGVGLMLVHVWQEQEKFDSFSHRGIHYSPKVPW